jgi:hypothetical protein
MSKKKYQVNFDESGEIVSAVRLPDEVPKKRSIIVREDTLSKAKAAAKIAYSTDK